MSLAGEPLSSSDEYLNAFWEVAKRHAKLGRMPGYFGPGPLESLPPPAWSFGATPHQADELLDLVLSGTKSATASALWDYEAVGEPPPEAGALGILLDGSGRAHALVQTTEVRVVPFDEVDDEHARREGEGDLSLRHWRDAHEAFFTEHAQHHRGFAPDMPVVLERFAVVYQE